MLYLRELLDAGVLKALTWQDTRDMISDGLTKGAVDRKALHDAMDGIVRVLHECKPWQPKHLAPKTAAEPSHASWLDTAKFNQRLQAYFNNYVCTGPRA